MKLLKNGELGIYVNSTYVESLNTVALLDDEINNVVLGNFDPVPREDDTVVDPNEYIEFLKLRRSQLIDTLKQHVSSESLRNKVSNSTQSDLTNEVADLKKQLHHSTMIIKKLMELAKADVAEDVAEDVSEDVAEDVAEDAEIHISSKIKANPIYNSELNMSASSANAFIKGVFRDIIKNMDPDGKPSDFINVAVARGLLGDDRARLIIDELYDEDMYDKFLERLEGPNIDVNTTIIAEPSEPSEPSEP